MTDPSPSPSLRLVPPALSWGDRKKLPGRTRSQNIKIEILGFTYYIHCMESDGELGAISISYMEKPGADLHGWTDAFSRLFTLALQHGADLNGLIAEFMSGDEAPRDPLDAIARAIYEGYLCHEEAEQAAAE